MSERTKSERDAFAFSLSGLRTMAAYTTATAIAQDQINQAWEEKLRREQEDQPNSAREIGTVWGRFWLRKLRRAA